MKYNLIFLLGKKTIIVKQVNEDGTRKTIDVDGMEKYEYDSLDEFEHFFEALKTDIYNIQDFSEEEFHATVLNMGVSEDVIIAFKEYLADCKEMTVLDSEIAKALTGNMNDDEIEKLKNTIAEKENEIKSLNEKELQIHDYYKKTIDELKDTHKTEMEDLKAIHEKELDDCKKQFAPKKLEPQRWIIKAEDTGKLHRRELDMGTFTFFINDIENLKFVTNMLGRTSVEPQRKFVLETDQIYDIMYDKGKFDDRASERMAIPSTGFLFEFLADGEETKKGDVIAVISSDMNDTKTAIKDWLKTQQLNVSKIQIFSPLSNGKYSQKETPRFRIEKIISEGSKVNAGDCIAKLIFMENSNTSDVNISDYLSTYYELPYSYIPKTKGRCEDINLMNEGKSTEAKSFLEAHKTARQDLIDGKFYISIEAPCTGTLHYIKNDEVGDGEIFAEIV